MAVVINGNGTVTGVTAQDELNVDSNTLVVDSTNNRVGIGTSSPSAELHIVDTSSACTIIAEGNIGQISLKDNNGGTDSKIATIRSVTADTVFGTQNDSYAGFSEKMRILSSGGITFNGDTSSANALDDYEEGTWTPTGNTVTFSGAGGNYTKIGDIVVATFSVSMPSTSSSSHMTISGLPFGEVNTNLQGQSITYGGSLGYCSFTAASSSRMAINTTTILFYDSGTSTLTESNCSGSEVRGTIVYKTPS